MLMNKRGWCGWEKKKVHQTRQHTRCGKIQSRTRPRKLCQDSTVVLCTFLKCPHLACFRRFFADVKFSSKMILHCPDLNARSRFSGITPCLVRMSASCLSEFTHLTATLDAAVICLIDRASIAVRFFSESPNPDDWLLLTASNNPLQSVTRQHFGASLRMES